MAQLTFPIDLHLIGYETIGHPGYVQALQQKAVDLNLPGQVVAHGPISHHELLPLTGQYDVGLALMPIGDDNLNHSAMTGASNKPFEYLACGLPLIVSDLPDWQEFFVEPGYGLACNPNDPISIAAVLRWYAEHPVERQSMGDAGQQQIKRAWNYEAQFEPIVTQICASLPNQAIKSKVELYAD